MKKYIRYIGLLVLVMVLCCGFKLKQPNSTLSAGNMPDLTERSFLKIKTNSATMNMVTYGALYRVMQNQTAK